MDKRPIGVFDSGVGGLTVMKEVIDLLPKENIVYLGDTARVPYGSKPEETIREYSIQCANFLKSKDVKAIVIACNTATVAALEQLKEDFDIPIIGVIDPGARSAAATTENGKIGVIATAATINSHAYRDTIKKHSPKAQVFEKACPLFVPIVEEGWECTEVAVLTAERYLSELIDKDIDTLVLGCTHYPMLSGAIKKVVGPDVTLVNPAIETSQDLKKVLEEKNLVNESNDQPKYDFYASGSPDSLRKIGTNLLKREMDNISTINIDEF